MDYKINKAALDTYVYNLGNKLCEEVFSKTTHVDGAGLKNFCTVPQINLFIIKSIYSKWEKETAKLESPYFDFKALEVQEALSVFMNILSKNICIKRTDLEPLVFEAIRQTFLLTTNPYQFFKTFILSLPGETTTLDELGKRGRFIKINSQLLDGLKKKVGEKPSYAKTDLLNILTEIYQDVSESLLPLNELIDSVSVHYKIKVGDLDAAVQEIAEPPKFKNKETELPQATAPAHKERADTLNDSIASSSEEKKAIFEVHQNNRIMDVSSAVSINQRFMFIKELFKGNFREYESALKSIVEAYSYNQAVNSLLEGYAEKYEWDIDKEEVKELFELIGRKFQKEEA